MSTNRFEVAIKIDEISVQTTLADQSIPISMIPPRPARTSQHIHLRENIPLLSLGLLDVKAGSSHL